MTWLHTEIPSHTAHMVKSHFKTSRDDTDLWHIHTNTEKLLLSNFSDRIRTLADVHHCKVILLFSSSAPPHTWAQRLDSQKSTSLSTDSKKGRDCNFHSNERFWLSTHTFPVSDILTSINNNLSALDGSTFLVEVLHEEFQRLCVSLRLSREQLTTLTDRPSHRSQPSSHLLLKKTRTSVKVLVWYGTGTLFSWLKDLVLLPGCFSAEDGLKLKDWRISYHIMLDVTCIWAFMLTLVMRSFKTRHHFVWDAVSASVSVEPLDIFNKTFSKTWKLNRKHCNHKNCSL